MEMQACIMKRAQVTLRKSESEMTRTRFYWTPGGIPDARREAGIFYVGVMREAAMKWHVLCGFIRARSGLLQLRAAMNRPQSTPAMCRQLLFINEVKRVGQTVLTASICLWRKTNADVLLS